MNLGNTLLLLVTGSSEGDIKIWAASAAALEQGDSLKCLFKLEAGARLPITCLDAAVVRERADGPSALIVAAGTTAGGLMVYRSGPFQHAGRSLWLQWALLWRSASRY